jgi:predicted flap endonuclease-1-like 5' DNA nuclease
MNLVSSNDANDAQQIVKQALEAYKKDADIEATLGVLTKLRGIGPATASLLLAVHDATRVIFFADEAFWWLCCNGEQSPIKYNAKEYRTLCSKVDDLRSRLDVQASDVEKVAYVLMKQPAQPDQSHDVAPPKEAKQDTSPTTAKKEKKRKSNSKTEMVQDATHEQPSLRRSKRVKI